MFSSKQHLYLNRFMNEKKNKNKPTGFAAFSLLEQYRNENGTDVSHETKENSLLISGKSNQFFHRWHIQPFSVC